MGFALITEASQCISIASIPRLMMRVGCSWSTWRGLLAEHPEFYHLLANSCTINIVRYANAAGRGGGFKLRHLLNGLVDGYLYDSGGIDATLPFEELRRRSLINEAARAADGDPDFSQRIRTSLPTMPH